VGILDRLESKGLVQRERNEKDRREIAITATQAGLKLASQTPFPLQYSLGNALSQLSEQERDEIARWMERLVELMGIREIDPSPMLEINALGERQTK
jgi:DNA-binding MarR family transcriptional regulator